MTGTPSSTNTRLADDKATHEAWVTDIAAALRQSDGGAYANFLGDEGEARVRAAYPGAT